MSCSKNTPRPLGDPYILNDYAMMYNRFGEAVLFMLAISVFVPVAERGGSKIEGWGESFALALFLSLLMFIKLNYFVVGVFLFLVGSVLGTVGKRVVCQSLVLLIILVAVVLMGTGIPPCRMVGDLLLMVEAQDFSRKVYSLIVQAIKHAPLLLLHMAMGMFLFFGYAKIKNTRLGFQAIVILAALALSALLLLSSNCQRNDMPLLAAGAVVTIYFMFRKRDCGFPDERGRWHFVGLSCLLLLVNFGPLMVSDFSALRNSYFNTVTHGRTNRLLAGTNLADFVFETAGLCASRMAHYEQKVVDGIRLIENNLGREDRLCVAMFTNPFSMGLNMNPIQGGFICFADNAFSASRIGWDRVIGDADYLLCRKDAFGGLLEIFEKQVDESDFKFMASSDYFALYSYSRSE